MRQVISQTVRPVLAYAAAALVVLAVAWQVVDLAVPDQRTANVEISEYGTRDLEGVNTIAVNPELEVLTLEFVVPVLDENRNKTRQGRAWVYVGDHSHPHTVFDYTPNRNRDGPLTFLESFTGYLQADAYSGYDALYTTGRVVEVACWAPTSG